MKIESVTKNALVPYVIEQSDRGERSYFKDVEIDEVFSDKPVGQIVKQTPEAGSEVIPEETTVIFQVSKGKKIVEVSDLKNIQRL